MTELCAHGIPVNSPSACPSCHSDALTNEDVSAGQFYRVIVDDKSEQCENCGHGAFWTIAHIEDGEEIGIGTSWGDKELADDICDLMNMAYDRGQEETDKLRMLINRVLEWEPAFPVESGLLDELAAAVKAPLAALQVSDGQ